MALWFTGYMDLVSQPVIEPMSPALQGRFLNHWTPKEVPSGGEFFMLSEL